MKMTALVKAVNKVDNIYNLIDAKTRTDFERILDRAAQLGEFSIVLEQYHELIDQLRLENFFEMPLGFEMVTENLENGQVQTRMMWGTESNRNATVVTELIQQSVQNFETHLSENEQSIFNTIMQQIDENDFFKNTSIALYDEAVTFVDKYEKYYQALGYEIKFGMGEDPNLRGRAEAKDMVRFLTIY